MRQARHPNVVEVFGTASYVDGRPAFVMLWYWHGNVLDYLKTNPDADKLKLVCSVESLITQDTCSSPPDSRHC